MVELSAFSRNASQFACFKCLRSVRSFAIDFNHTLLTLTRNPNEFVFDEAKNVHTNAHTHTQNEMGGEIFTATYQRLRINSKQKWSAERRKCSINNSVVSIGIA